MIELGPRPSDGPLYSCSLGDFYGVALAAAAGSHSISAAPFLLRVFSCDEAIRSIDVPVVRKGVGEFEFGIGGGIYC